MNEDYTVPPVPGTKLTKDRAGYVAKGPFACRTCRWFVESTLPAPAQGACPVTGTLVDPGGCCDAWNKPLPSFNVGKRVAEYVYVEGSTYTCKECGYYNAATKSCWPVDGSIEPEGSCNKWTPRT